MTIRNALFAAAALAAAAAPAAANPYYNPAAPIYRPIPGTTYALGCRLMVDAGGRFAPTAAITNGQRFTLAPGTRIDVIYYARAGYKWIKVTTVVYVGHEGVQPGATFVHRGYVWAYATGCAAYVTYPNAGRVPPRLTH
jgi:hypothetical protein